MWSTSKPSLCPSSPGNGAALNSSTPSSPMPRLLSPLRVLALCLCVFAAVCVSSETSPSSAAKRSLVDDSVRVLYCTSCGFKQNFMEVKTFLEDKYPHLVGSVHGANYAVDPWKALLAQTLGYAQLAAMVLMVLGEQIFKRMGWDDTLLQKALDNRIGCFAVILLMGSVSQGLVSTGAFEVYYNGDLVFSKLQTGHWPTLQQLGELLEAKGMNAFY